MKKWVLTLLIIFALGWMFWPRIHKASAAPEAHFKITMSIRPMPGIHSDWHRKATITYKGERISKELLEDTGWWRGSNLYRHISGAYVVHEGQGWCFGFTLEPLEFDRTLEDVCIKDKITTDTLNGRSHYYRDLVYLGHFYETWRDKDGVRIRYSGADRTPEVELPDGP